MKVLYKDDIMGNFNYKEGDYITIVLCYLTKTEGESELYYHGTVKKIDSTNGIWCVLDNKTEEEYFSFSDIESVFDGDKIPFFAGSMPRPGFNPEHKEQDEKQTLTLNLDSNLIAKLKGIAILKGVTMEKAAELVIGQYTDIYTDKIAKDREMGKM